MNKFKQISLIFASLFILASSTASQSFNANTASFQNKNTDQSISAILADEVDVADDIGQISNTYQLHFVQLAVPLASRLNQPLHSTAHRNLSLLPFYLKIQNLRI